MRLFSSSALSLALLGVHPAATAEASALGGGNNPRSVDDDHGAATPAAARTLKRLGAAPPPHPGKTKSSSCKVLVAEFLSTGSALPGMDFECEADPDDAGGVSGVVRKIEASDDQLSKLRGLFERGELVSGKSTLEHGVGASFGKSEIVLPPDLDVVAGVNKVGNGNKNKAGGNDPRRLATTKGEKKVLAVRVRDARGKVHPDSAAMMSDNIFGTEADPVNLKSQLAACSFGQLNIIAGDGGSTIPSIDQGLYAAPGVVEVDIPIDIEPGLFGDPVDRFDVRNAVTAAVQEKLGIALPGPYQHVMYVLEGCYGAEDCGWAAYAYINSWNSVYQGDYYFMTGVQVHEFGHNFNLAHSGGINGATYTDHTCMMGNPLFQDDVGHMCFNAAKNWQLDWYDNENGKKVIDPTDTGWQYERVNMVGIAEYDVKSVDQPVTVKLETGASGDYFVGFNRKTRANGSVQEAADEVTVVQVLEGDGEGYSQSYLKATLANGESFSISGVAAWGGDLTVSVTGIDVGTVPGVAGICISRTGTCDGSPAPPTPGSPPTPSNPPPGPSSGGGVIDDAQLCGNVDVGNVFRSGDGVTTFGCIGATSPGNAFDGMTDPFECTKDSLEVNPKRNHGFIVTPSNGDRTSIVKKLRVYANADCANCDAVTYKVEGRGGPNCFRVANLAEDSSTWRLIRKGNLPWSDETAPVDRNPVGLSIESNYTAGDADRSFTEVDLLNTESECSEYRITFKYTRLESSPTIKIGEVELGGRITNDCVTSPTSPPVPLPTASPTTSSPTCTRVEESSVFEPGDFVTTFGCEGEPTPGNTIDGTTNFFQCLKDPAVTDRKHGIIVSPSDGARSSIVKRLRVYAGDDCMDCDPVVYKVEGRGGPNCFRVANLDSEESSTWRLIRKGDLPWSFANTTTNPVDRNPIGQLIGSNYTTGDANLTFTEVDLLNAESECSEYQITFSYTRLDNVSTPIKFGEVELVGLVTNACITNVPTRSPTAIPTSTPTVSAKPTLTPIPSASPTISSAPSCGLKEVSSVFEPSDAVATFGCESETSPENAFDGTIDSFQCVKDPAVTDNKHGIIVTPHDGRHSVVERLRVYANDDCEDCDAVTYKVEGRGGTNCIRVANLDLEESSTWRLIRKGSLPWILNETIGRNPVGHAVNSSYIAGDADLYFTEVDLLNTESECSEYQITFAYTRLDNLQNPIKVGEVELVGKITNACDLSPTSSSPTSSPTSLPTASPTSPTPPGTTDAPTSSPTAPPTNGPTAPVVINCYSLERGACRALPLTCKWNRRKGCKPL